MCREISGTAADPSGHGRGNVDSLSDLTRDVKDALASDGPRLIEITQRRLAGPGRRGRALF